MKSVQRILFLTLAIAGISEASYAAVTRTCTAVIWCGSTRIFCTATSQTAQVTCTEVEGKSVTCNDGEGEGEDHIVTKTCANENLYELSIE